MRLLALFLPLAVFAAPPTLRLPDTSRPHRYAIELELDPAKEGYTGAVTIEVEVTKTTRELWLNAEGLKIQTAEWNGRRVDNVQTEASDFAGFLFNQPLAPGRGRLRIMFSGQFDQKNSNGIFRMEEGGDWYLFTQFEPIAARAAFPCYDEPGYKVPWQLTLRIPSSLKAAANTPQVDEAAEGAWKRLRFAESLPMPSYLVAFAVGPFEFVDAGKAGRKQTPLRIITPRGKAAEARYAVEVTGKILAELEDYFGLPYPYEKLDSIAIPLTFGFGAMENAGLITYARTLLLSPAEKENDSFRQAYLSVAAHEIAHQWFGNLVTPEYWDDIWLNEAFASWLESKITQKMRPEWQRDLRELEGRHQVMGQDALVSVRRIRQPILNNGDIVNAFDGITYTKGAAVIGMFENWMGEEAFREGVRRYMRQYAWRNATAGMFLDSISGPGARSVPAAFNTFLNQAGVPLLHLDVQCGQPQPRVRVRQERFLPIGSKGTAQQSWQLPVCFSYDRDGKPHRQCVLLAAENQEIPLETNACPAWLNGNAGATGYYRVAYPEEWLAKLTGANALNEAETADLLNNALALANAGRLPVASLMELAQRNAKNPDWNVRSRALELLRALDPILAPEDRPAYANRIRDWFGVRARELGWRSNERPSPQLNQERLTLVPVVASLGEDPTLREQALVLARAWIDDRGTLPSDVARVMFPIAVQHGGKAFFDEVRAALKTTTDRAERSVLISGLGGSNDPALAREGLRMLLARELDFREGLPILYGLAQGDRTRELSYTLARDNYDSIMAIAPSGGSFNFGSTLPNLARGLCTAPQATEVREFFSHKLQGITGADRTIENVVEAIELCAARRAALGPGLQQAFRQN
jgi:alanyl aminopeptidase